MQYTLKGRYEEDAVLREVLRGRRRSGLQDKIATLPEDATYYDRVRLGELVVEVLEERRDGEAEQIVERLEPFAVASWPLSRASPKTWSTPPSWWSGSAAASSRTPWRAWEAAPRSDPAAAARPARAVRLRPATRSERVGLMTGLLGLPLAPVRGVLWVAEQVREHAEEQYYDPVGSVPSWSASTRRVAAASSPRRSATELENELLQRLMVRRR